MRQVRLKHPTLTEFGRLLRRQRERKGFSQMDLFRMTKAGLGHYSDVENGRAKFAAPMMRLLAAVLGIADIEAWIVACHGVDGPLSFGQAQSVCDALQIGAQPAPDVSKLASRLRRKHHCNRCQHQWKGHHDGLPTTCPMCGTRGWREEWSEEREKRYQATRKKAKAYWATQSRQARREAVLRRTKKAVAA